MCDIECIYCNKPLYYKTPTALLKSSAARIKVRTYETLLCSVQSHDVVQSASWMKASGWGSPFLWPSCDGESMRQQIPRRSRHLITPSNSSQQQQSNNNPHPNQIFTESRSVAGKGTEQWGNLSDKLFCLLKMIDLIQCKITGRPLRQAAKHAYGH